MADSLWRTLSPMLAVPGDQLPTGPGWGYEVKWDGIRALARIGADGVELRSRSGRSLTDRFPGLAAAGRAMGAAGPMILDGECVAFDPDGHPDFAGVLRVGTPVRFVAFDLVGLRGADLRGTALHERRRRLLGLGLAEATGGAWWAPEGFLDGPALVRATIGAGLEGVLAKREDSPYRSGARHRDWQKFPNRVSDDLVVVGYARAEAGPGASSLLVSSPAGLFLGSVGSGITQRTGRAIALALDRIALPGPDPDLDFTAVPIELVATRFGDRIHWARPELLVTVSHLASGSARGAGTLRQPSLRGLEQSGLRPVAKPGWRPPAPAPPPPVVSVVPGEILRGQDSRAVDLSPRSPAPARPENPAVSFPPLAGRGGVPAGQAALDAGPASTMPATPTGQSPRMARQRPNPAGRNPAATGPANPEADRGAADAGPPAMEPTATGTATAPTPKPDDPAATDPSPAAMEPTAMGPATARASEPGDPARPPDLPGEGGPQAGPAAPPPGAAPDHPDPAPSSQEAAWVAGASIGPTGRSPQGRATPPVTPDPAGGVPVMVGGRTLRLTDLDKALYPGDGSTKAQLIAYLVALAEPLLGQLAGRPITRRRWPDGVPTDDPDGSASGSQSVAEKGVPKTAPAWLTRVSLNRTSSDGRSKYPGYVDYPVLLGQPDDVAALAWFAQAGVLELHAPQWRVRRRAQFGTPGPADRMILSLTAGSPAGPAQCAQVAQTAREILSGAGFGVIPVAAAPNELHLYVPFPEPLPPGQLQELAEVVAGGLAGACGPLVTRDGSPQARAGRVILDVSGNNPARTTVAPYSPRGLSLPFVATPLLWDEVRAGKCGPATIHTMARRVHEVGDLMTLP